MRGSIPASTLEEAKQKLHQQNLFILEIRPQHKNYRFKKISLKEVYRLSVLMSQLQTSGLTLHDSIKALTYKIKSIPIQMMLQKISERISAGYCFSEAIHDIPLFDEVGTSLLLCAEKGGKITEFWSTISQYLQKKIEFRNEITKAMSYPLFLLFFMLAIFTLLMVAVIPSIRSIVEVDQLHFFSRFLFTLSDLMQKTSFWITLFAASISLASIAYLARHKLKQLYHSIILKIPFVRTLTIQSSLLYMSLSLDTLSEHNLPITDSLELIKNMFFHPGLKKDIALLKEELIKGKSLSAAIHKIDWIPFEVSALIEVGEMSSNLKNAWHNIYLIHHTELSNRLKKISSFLGPIMIIIIGIVIGAMLIGIFYPILNIHQGISL